MKSFLAGMAMVLLLVSMVSQAQAFDGDRKGFMLNLGAGFGKAEITGSEGSASYTLDETGFGGDFKLGMGVNSQTMIYYTNRTLFYSMFGSDVVNGMSALATSYFFSPQAPSFFVTGGIGLGVFLDRDASESESGMGFTGGFGFEFSRNWIIEATYMNATVFTEGDYDLSISNLMISVSWFAY